MTTTLNKIREHLPCTSGWSTLLKSLNKTKPDNEELTIKHIIDSNGIEDAIWCLRAVDGYDKEIKLFAIWCARQVQHLIIDEKIIKALDIAEAYINGAASEKELEKLKYPTKQSVWYVATIAAHWHVALSANAAINNKETQKEKLIDIIENGI